MVHRTNPALDAFLAVLPETLEFAQVLISRRGHHFELRHSADRTISDTVLESLTVTDLRGLANDTAAGAFRPLKSAPTLRGGWRVLLTAPADLELALDHLYPGALADWYAVRAGKAAGIAYRDYVNRQTGMYRITQLLNDEQVADVAQAACHRSFCLKQRLWHGPLLSADKLEEKSLVPCLEPCPMLLEFARKSMRLEQEEHVSPSIAEGDLQTLLAAVETALLSPGVNGREADFTAAANPRRLRRVRILLERWLAQVPRKEDKE